MHLSNLNGVFAKADYTNHEKTALDKVFPTALTNKITLHGSTVDNIIKVATLLDDMNAKSNQRLGYMILDHQHDKKPVGVEEKQAYFKNLNRQASKRIQALVKSPNAHDYVQFERWHDYSNKQSLVLFVNPCGTTDDTAKLKAYAESLSDNSDDYTPSDTQKLLNILLKLFVKLTLVHSLSFNKETLSQGRVNLNNEIGFLVRTDGLSDSDKEDFCGPDKVLYHTLVPSVRLNSYNDLIVEVKYQRYNSVRHNPDILESDCIDVYIPNALPARYSDFYHRNANDDFRLVKESANEGERGVKFIDLSAFDESLIHYEASIVLLVEQILIAANIKHERYLFEPTWRARTFKALGLPQANEGSKPKLVIINALSSTVRKGRSIATNRYQPATETYKSNKKGKTIRNSSEDISVKFSFENKLAIAAYIDYLQNDFFKAYDTSVIKYKDVVYDELSDDVSYLVLQDTAMQHGYWHFCDAKKEAALKEKLGKKWQSKVGLSFKDSAITIPRENDFFKILHSYQKNRQENPDVNFYTDPYTTLKIKQYESAVKGVNKKILQGHHLPPLSTLGGVFLNYEDHVKDQSEIDRYVRRPSINRAPKLFDAALTKMEIDLNIKKALSTKGVLNLQTSQGLPADFSAYAGKYRCYYVVRPKIHKAGNKFFASQIDITVSSEGIVVDSTKLLTNESHIRGADKFAISEAAHPNLYNDSFYMVNEVGDVLTCYTSRNIVRPLTTIPSTGKYAGCNSGDFIQMKKDEIRLEVEQAMEEASEGKLISPFDPNAPVPIKKALSADESRIIAFYALASSTTESDHAYRFTDSEGKTRAYGGREWLFFNELKSGMLSMFLTNKHDLNKAQTKANRVYNILVKSASGETLRSATSPLALLYIDTTTFHLARVNSFSAKSIFHGMTKMVLKD